MLIAAMVLLAGMPLGAETLVGVIVGIADGDTITVVDADRQQHKVRLAGIDAPEKRQDFGYRSKQSLSDLTYRKMATVETSRTDRYGRVVGKVLVNAQDINLEQVRRGMAWHYKAYEREQPAADRQAYADAENAARASRTGLWGMPSPIPPWDFRRSKQAADLKTHSPRVVAAMGWAAPGVTMNPKRVEGLPLSITGFSNEPLPVLQHAR